MLSSRTKHVLHCTLLLLVIVFFQIIVRYQHDQQPDFDPWIRYGFLGASLFSTLRLFILLSLPENLFQLVGLTLYNAFRNRVALKYSPLYAPLMCIRVVTRGTYPKLVKTNVERNLAKCVATGLDNYFIEVVTDKAIGLPTHDRVKETVVPPDYRTKSGALFKARALQYCLEDDVNVLSDNDWIVHLDEETLLTENSICGILNFVTDGKHHFGQGLITYANGEVVNWVTTLADSMRVSDDMGRLRLQFSMFHKPLFNWKGSYVVAQLGAERMVSFDNGPEGSLAEDCFFAMRAYKEGFSFDFIEGEMLEKSPFTIWDFVQQRKRWFQGVLLVVHSSRIPIRHKFFLATWWYSWLTRPLTTLSIILAWIHPVPCTPFIGSIWALMGAVGLYMIMFGVIKSFSLHWRGVVCFTLCILGALCIGWLNILLDNVVVIWGLLSKKNRFHIVDKEIRYSLHV